MIQGRDIQISCRTVLKFFSGSWGETVAALQNSEATEVTGMKVFIVGQPLAMSADVVLVTVERREVWCSVCGRKWRWRTRLVQVHGNV